MSKFNTFNTAFYEADITRYEYVPSYIYSKNYTMPQKNCKNYFDKLMRFLGAESFLYIS